MCDQSSEGRIGIFVLCHTGFHHRLPHERLALESKRSVSCPERGARTRLTPLIFSSRARVSSSDLPVRLPLAVPSIHHPGPSSTSTLLLPYFLLLSLWCAHPRTYLYTRATPADYFRPPPLCWLSLSRLPVRPPPSLSHLLPRLQLTLTHLPSPSL